VAGSKLLAVKFNSTRATSLGLCNSRVLSCSNFKQHYLAEQEGPSPPPPLLRLLPSCCTRAILYTSFCISWNTWLIILGRLEIISSQMIIFSWAHYTRKMESLTLNTKEDLCWACRIFCCLETRYLTNPTRSRHSPWTN
jgi:hypothetical protein